MGKGGQLVKAEHRPRALDSVQSAKDAAHQLWIVAALVQLEQRRLQIDENLTRFFAKALLELLGVA